MSCTGSWEVAALGRESEGHEAEAFAEGLKT